jgi:hypothetical protein
LGSHSSSLDFSGNSRIGTSDIGAYEIQYTDWTGTSDTDWSNGSNWGNGVPAVDGTSNVLIASNNYIPTASSVTIAPGYEILIKPGNALTVTGALTNNGTIRMESDATGISSLIPGSYVDNGNEEIQLHLIGGYSDVGINRFYNWHYISSPVTSLSTDVFSNRGVLNLAQYIEGQVNTDPIMGWYAYDGYRYPSGPITSTTFNNLAVGKGYDYYFLEERTYTFGGSFNTSNVTINLDLKGLNDEIKGLNLIGNPFSSCIDWDYIISHNNFSTDIDNAIYFTVYGQSASYVGGVPQGGASYGIIPPMQGFFVRTRTDNTSFILDKNSRLHDLTQARYKGAGSSIPLVRLKLQNQKNKDDAVVRFDNEATNKFDKSFDAYKLSKNLGILNIWTKSQNTDFSINGLPFPSVSVEIPVGIYVLKAGTYKLSANEIKELSGYNVILRDKVTNISVDLKSGGEISFAATEGITEDRFVLAITAIITGISENITTDREFNILFTNGNLNIEPLSETWNGKKGTITIYDLTGRRILQQSDIEWHKGENRQVMVNVLRGLYLVEIRGGTNRYIGKVNIFK